MAKAVIMPRFGMTQEVAVIARWLKREGDAVEKGEPIAEVETDKVNMEVEAPATGTLAGLQYAEGDTVPVTEVIAYILAEGERLPQQPGAARPSGSPPPPAAAQDEAVSATPVARRVAAAQGVDLAAVRGSGPGGRVTRRDIERHLQAVPAPPRDDARSARVRATPAARRLARQQGLDLGAVPGSGPRGRVQAADVAQAAAAVPAPAAAPEAGPEIIPLAGMRRTIAERLQASYQQAPHVTFTTHADMTATLAARHYANQRLPEGHPPISLTAFIIKACAWALRQHPALNSLFRDDQIYRMPHIHVGMAVALEDGLIVPVIHHADRKGLLQLGAEVADLTARAHQGSLRPQDVADGTFTVSNLGMFGVSHFTAIINPPQVAILAVGQVEKRFVPDENERPVLKPMMTLTLAVDHRVIDGAQAARFLADLRRALEEPVALLL